MTTEKLERVLWRLRTKHPKPKELIHNTTLRRAVILEIGYDYRTYNNIRSTLKRLGWIKQINTQQLQLTGTDLTGEF